MLCSSNPPGKKAAVFSVTWRGVGKKLEGEKLHKFPQLKKNPCLLQEPQRRCKVSSVQRAFCREESRQRHGTVEYLSRHGICHGCTEIVHVKSLHNLKVIVRKLKCLKNIPTSRQFWIKAVFKLLHWLSFYRVIIYSIVRVEAWNSIRYPDIKPL